MSRRPCRRSDPPLTVTVPLAFSAVGLPVNVMPLLTVTVLLKAAAGGTRRELHGEPSVRVIAGVVPEFPTEVTSYVVVVARRR